VELALADLQRADALCPDDPTICAVYNKLPKLLRIHGDELMAVGMFQEAADKFSRAVAGLDANAANSPSTAATSLKEYCQVKKAECLYNLGEHDACVATCTALLVDGGTGSNYIAAATYIRGVEYYAIGELDLAAEDLGEAHRLSPDHVTIHQAYKKVRLLRPIQRLARILLDRAHARRFNHGRLKEEVGRVSSARSWRASRRHDGRRRSPLRRWRRLYQQARRRTAHRRTWGCRRCYRQHR